MSGARCELDPKNIIMANIEELGEEEQRKYAKLQEFVKQQFLLGITKDRHGKTSRDQDFAMLAIKLNEDKVEVISNVSPTPDLTALTDKFNAAFKDQSDLVTSMMAKLERVEGKSFKAFDENTIPQINSQGVVQSGMSAAPIENPTYGMPANFYSGQTPPSGLVQKPTMATPVRPVPATDQTGQMTVVPEQPLPISVVPSSVTHNRVNSTGVVPPVYSTIAHTSTSNTSNGIPNDVYDDWLRLQNMSTPQVNSVNTLVPITSQPASSNEFSQFKEELANMIKINSVLIWVILDCIKNHIKLILIMFLFLLVGVYLILLNSMGKITARLGNILVNILLN